MSRFTATAATMAAGSASHSAPVSRKTIPQTTPASASTDPTDRSMWRAMIENVMASAARASGVFWAMIEGIVRAFSQLGETSQKSDDHPEGHRPQEREVGVAHRREAVADRVHASRAPRMSRSAMIASSRMPPSTAVWYSGGTPWSVW